MTLAIRQESPSDIMAIHALTKAAFLNAPHTAHTEQFIVDALRNANALSISLVAEDDGVILGHVAISPVFISDGASDWYGLGPLSVIPEHQRQGIGSRLMVEVLQRLKKKGASGCVLVGDPAYYARFGFSQEKSLVFPGVPPEYFQAIPFSRSLPQGVVKFHEAFGAKS
ncbi:MAG: N-acetyltransferase [Candidatus Accumulibacter sp.]|jgi:putative acetyltransferase|nr:N-acetyltransferase [Accumulibacter sp.]